MLRFGSDDLKAENKRLRAALQEQSDKNCVLSEQFNRISGEFNTIFDTVTALIWYRGKDGRLLRVNRAAAMSVGLTPQEMIGKDYYELFGDQSDEARSKDEAVISTGEPIIGDLRKFETVDGQVRYAMIDRYPYYGENGEIIGLVGFAQDVTERKLADDAVEEANTEMERINRQLAEAVENSDYLAEQAVAANKAKSRFVAAVSHDIRTGINAILGFSELLSEEDIGKDPLGYVKVIKSAADSILELTNDILDLSSMEANKLEIQATRECVGTLIGKVAELVAHSAAVKGIDFRFIAEGEVPAYIVTDSMRFRQCLLNLLSNAIKFTEHGHVHVTVSTVVEESGGYICFSVEDTGIGIAADRQQAIFESFSQARCDTKRKYGGTGLGLTITAKLASLLGGRIEVESEPGKGSRFTMLLPDVCGVADGLFDASKVDVDYSASYEDETGKSSSPITSDYADMDQMHEAISSLAVKLPQISDTIINALGLENLELVCKLVDVLVDAGDNAGYPLLVEKALDLRACIDGDLGGDSLDIAEELAGVCDRIATVFQTAVNN